MIDRDLNDELMDSGATEEEAQSLGSLAESIRSTAPNVPASTRERAFFVEGVAGRSQGALVRFLVPAVAVLLIVAVAILSRTALPGQALYPVREVLHSVGLAQGVSDDVKDHLQHARALLAQARSAEHRGDNSGATRLTGSAIFQLGQARELLTDLGSEQRGDAFDAIEHLRARALALLRHSLDISTEDGHHGGPHSANDDHGGSSGSDRSGKGSGSDDGSGSRSGSSGGSDGGSTSGGSGSDDTSSSSGSGSGGSPSPTSDDSGSSNSGSGSGGPSSGSGSSGPG